MVKRKRGRPRRKPLDTLIYRTLNIWKNLNIRRDPHSRIE